MRRAAFALAILSLFGAAAEAPAQETKLVPFTAPAYKGYVLSADLPKGWRPKIGAGRYWLYINANRPADKLDPVTLSLGVGILRKPMSFEKVVASKIKNFKYNPSTIYHKRGFNQVLGKKTFYYLHSSKYQYGSSKIVKIPSPTFKTYITVIDDRAVINFTLTTRRPDDYRKLLPLFERVARTVKVRPVSAVPPGQLSRFYTSPNVQFSRRRDYYLWTKFMLALPPGWSARKVAVRHAGRSSERGRMVIDMAPPKPARPGGRQKLTVAFEGLRVGALQPADFLATAKAHVAAVLTKARKIETPKSAQWSGQIGFGFCLMRKRMRRGAGTGKIHVATYLGEDKNGRARKLRIYTAGGLTMACNVIYAADPKTFDASWERVYGMISSLKTFPASPVLSVR